MQQQGAQQHFQRREAAQSPHPLRCFCPTAAKGKERIQPVRANLPAPPCEQLRVALVECQSLYYLYISAYGWPAPLFLPHRNLKVGAPFRPVLPGRGFHSPGEKTHPGNIGLGGAPEIKHFIRTPTAARPLSKGQGGLRRPGTSIEPEPTTIQ